MKTKITLLTLLFTCIGFAQNGINYKAVIKDDLGNVVASQTVSVRFTILEDATNVYQETHSPMTDANGILIVNIGEGTPVSGVFSDIDWGDDDHFLTVEIDPAGGTAYVSMGTTQFKTVPYAIASGDKSWEVETDNVHVLTKNVGIGTDSATELLHIYDDERAGINLSVPGISDESQIEFKNGSETDVHSFFRISNRNDYISFELDTDLTAFEGYEDIMSLYNSGLALADGARINEFSTDVTMGDNSNTAVPTERAVKTYVDNSINNISSEKTINIPATAFTANQSAEFINYRNYGAYAQMNVGNGSLIAPLIVPQGATITSMTFYLRDDDSGGNVNLECTLLIGLTTTNILSGLFNVATFSGSSDGITLNYENSISIENNAKYVIRVRPTSDWGPSDFGICSVKVTYTE